MILVNEENPITGLTLDQLDGIFGAARDGGWAGTNFRPDWARGPEQNIRSWGQLGLTGEWADQRINVYGFNLRYNTATDFADKVLKGSDKWNENIHAFAHIFRDDGSRYIQADQITDALAEDRFGIAFNRFRGERPRVRRLARIFYEGHPGPRPSGAGAYILAPARMCTSTLSFECEMLMVMTMLVRSRSYSLHHRPLCGFWLDLLPQIRHIGAGAKMYARAACARRARARMARVPCSLRRRGIYVFGREHESGARCGRPMGRPYDVYSANW